MTSYQLHLKLTALVKTERKITHEVLLCIQQMDLTKGYAELGHSSLFDYLVVGQKYSEGAAQRRISAARLLRELPEMETKLQEGSLNLTQISKLAVAVKQEQKLTGEKLSVEDKKDLLARIENKNSFETEKILSQELQCNFKPQEKITPQHDEVVLTVKLSQLQYEKLKLAQAILSHVHHEGGIAEVLETLCDKLIRQKVGVVVPAQGADLQGVDLQGVEDKTTAVAAAKKSLRRRRAIGNPIRRALLRKAGQCCEYVSPLTGRRCSSSYQLQVDHRRPRAKGGAEVRENLRILCRTHNLAEARRWGLGR